MIIFGYEEKVGETFVPNGTPPTLIKKMKTLKDPSDVFRKGCYQEDTGLVSSVYHCEHYPNSLRLKGIPYSKKLVVDIKNEFYYYMINPFGTTNGFLGIGKLQMNWPFVNSISDKVIDDLKLNKCKIIIDIISEGTPFSVLWMKRLYKLIDSVGILRKNVYYLTSNNRFKDDYYLEFKHDSKINIKQFNNDEVISFEVFKNDFDCEVNLENKRTKHFMSFNQEKKIHRTKLVNFLKNEKLLSKGYVSYKARGMYLDGPQKRGTELSGEEFYLDSYFNIVTETEYIEPTLRFSEKIFKPIIYKQPFILYSVPFLLKHLRSLGYKTFHPFIDESYDEITDSEERMRVLNREVKRLCSLSLKEIHKWYIDMKEILIYNFEHFQRAEERIDITL
jgi:hypothetical protein|tara:strand:- start:1168 stop:2337 length:1170 start_codon:yes stop_codon:yes gene_type:complete